ncbi:MAG: hypothetical protein IMZ57_03885 [Acidobacteria bacterium]|nr:hypothetical protein [Acidobacteriota bacterium]
MACKEKWYFKDMLDEFLQPLGSGFSELLQNKELSGGGVTYDDIQAMILQTGKTTSTEARKIIEALKKQIMSGNSIAIKLEVNPGYAGPIGLWVPLVEDFVRVYN